MANNEIGSLRRGITDELAEIADLRKGQKSTIDIDVKFGIQGMIDTKNKLIAAYKDRIKKITK